MIVLQNSQVIIDKWRCNFFGTEELNNMVKYHLAFNFTVNAPNINLIQKICCRFHCVDIGYNFIHISFIQDCGPEVFKTCQYLYNELLPLPDHSTGATASIITNIYSKLWNVAIKLEQDKATQQPDVVFQLRYMAIKMLLLRRTAVGQTVDKFLLAVDR